MDETVTFFKTTTYTETLFRSWTDGPKYVLDTKRNTDCLNLSGVAVTYVIDYISDLENLLESFALNSPATIYLVDDMVMAAWAIEYRPDLNIELVLVDWDNV
jgi:hypothetical protein